MKDLKMLAMAAVAAMALAAFGVSSASATTLCENTAQTTGCTKHVVSGSAIAFSAEGSMVKTGPFGEVIATCTESTISGTTTSTGASAVKVTVSISTLTFTGCGTRTVTVNSATTGTLAIESIAGTDNGTVKSNDTTWTVTNVPLLGTCRYLTNNTDIGKLTGGLPGSPTLDIAASIPSENGCPTVTWEGSYVYTGSTPFNVSAS